MLARVYRLDSFATVRRESSAVYNCTDMLKILHGFIDLIDSSASMDSPKSPPVYKCTNKQTELLLSLTVSVGAWFSRGPDAPPDTFDDFAVRKQSRRCDSHWTGRAKTRVTACSSGQSQGWYSGPDFPGSPKRES